VIDAVLSLSRPRRVPQTARTARQRRPPVAQTRPDTPGDPCLDDEEIISVAEVKLSAENRSEFGKGAARRLRRAHKVPAVLYGHGADPVHVALPGHETMLALKHSNTLLTLDVEGTTHLALPKDVQRNPVRGSIEHVDLLLVRRGERVTVDIPVHVTGAPASGTIVNTDYTTLSVEVEATAIPQQLVVDIEGAEDGTHITAADVVLPAGATLVTDPEALVVTISTPGEADLGAEAEGEAATDGAAAAADEA
jgi:large subunit ribosomal protein L25